MNIYLKTVYTSNINYWLYDEQLLNYGFEKRSLCQLFNTRNTNNETTQIQALKEVKNIISQEATRFSGHQQHVRFLRTHLKVYIK